MKNKKSLNSKSGRYQLKDGTKLYYQVFGPDLKQQNIKTLVFIHGGPGLVDGRLYYSFWSKFASENVRVIFPEQRGSGRSDDPKDSSTLNINQHAEDIHELWLGLGIKNPIVAGVSQGGYVSLAIASQFSKEIAGVILSNTEAKRNTENRANAYLKSLPAFFGQTEEKAKQLSELIIKIDKDWDEKTYSENFGGYYTKKGETYTIERHENTWTKFMGHEFGTFDLRPQMKNITSPVLYMAGEYDCVHPATSAEQTKELMTNAKVDFHLIKDSGDPVYVDQEEQATKLVKDFMQLQFKHD